MKNILLVSIILTLSVGKSLAVWPPSTAVKEEETSSVRRAALRNARPVTDRLEEDTQRLEEALRDLKADQKELKQSIQSGRGASKFHDSDTVYGESR